MLKFHLGLISLIFAIFLSACSENKTNQAAENSIVQAAYVTDPVDFDTDDPAIWLNKSDLSQSLIIGTDKDSAGGLYVFDLKGKQIASKTIKGLLRPNNVDIEYGLNLNNIATDIAVVTERFTGKLRIFSLPDMKAVDNGGISVFEGETCEECRDLMGISLYRNPLDGKIYAIVGRKTGPTDGSYLWQYLLEDNGQGNIKASLVRKFGKYSGAKEIEAIAVDDKLGYVYYSDETFGVRKYYADPSKGNDELAVFGKGNFSRDNEGISIYEYDDSTGYILVSDQQVNTFQVFKREGGNTNPHEHVLVKTIPFSTNESDGSEVTSISLNDEFEGGLFVAMSDNKTFHLYRWKDLAGKSLKVRKGSK
jgi:3-phytase